MPMPQAAKEGHLKWDSKNVGLGAVPQSSQEAMEGQECGSGGRTPSAVKGQWESKNVCLGAVPPVQSRGNGRARIWVWGRTPSAVKGQWEVKNTGLGAVPPVQSRAKALGEGLCASPPEADENCCENILFCHSF